jgi:hypothetical protein
MSLSRRQKILSAVFLIGLIALVADRTVLGPSDGPRAASADPLPPPLPTVAPSDRLPAAEPTPPVTAAQRLDRLTSGKEIGSGALRDPFSLPPSWSDTTAARREGTADATEVFVRRHQFRAVVVRNGQSSALVDDTSLIPGQSLDGFTLIAVGPRSALFERDGRQVVLSLAGP